MSNNDSEVSSSISNNKMEKPQKNWFRSLSRRKKKSSSTTNSNAIQVDDAAAATDPTAAGCTASALPQSLPPQSVVPQPPPPPHIGNDTNIFQRFKKKMEIRFSTRKNNQKSTLSIISLSNGIDDRHHHHHPPSPPPMQSHRRSIGDANNDDLSAVSHHRDQRPWQSAATETAADHEIESANFTHYYRRYLGRKWLELPSEPNLVMYKASSDMLSHVWYWGELSRQDAQKQLTDKPNGSFLLRDSETQKNQFALSFRIGNFTLHYRLQCNDNYWHFEDLQYESIVEMIEDIMHRSTDENFVCYVKVPTAMQPPIPVLLKYPISRYSKIPSLQELSRRIIQRYISDSNSINTLPIPVKLQQYLNERVTQIV